MVCPSQPHRHHTVQGWAVVMPELTTPHRNAFKAVVDCDSLDARFFCTSRNKCGMICAYSQGCQSAAMYDVMCATLFSCVPSHRVEVTMCRSHQFVQHPVRLADVIVHEMALLVHVGEKHGQEDLLEGWLELTFPLSRGNAPHGQEPHLQVDVPFPPQPIQDFCYPAI
jgi:hypothetical protein